MDEKVKEQILAIRDTGLTNMFDLPVVQRLAYERDFYELVLYLEEHRKEYVHFIMTGSSALPTSGTFTNWSCTWRSTGRNTHISS